METNQAAENLQVIRTLMERSALYRRALAPVMTFVGFLGVAVALIGVTARLTGESTFLGLWICASVVAMSGAFLLIRRQALKAAEPFWTPPTRRIAMAIAPCFTVGAAVSAIFLLQGSRGAAFVLLPPVWMALYGCALHAAGFFIPRGINWLGWLFIASGCGLLVLGFGFGVEVFNGEPSSGYWTMGASFGGLHLAYGIYLYLTEQRKNVA